MLAMKNNAESYQEAELERIRDYGGRDSRPQKKEHYHRVSMVLCIMTAISALWVVCSEGAQIYGVSFENVRLQTQIQSWSANDASLTAKVDELERPSRILNIAINQDHMQYANPVRIDGSASGK